MIVRSNARRAATAFGDDAFVTPRQEKAPQRTVERQSRKAVAGMRDHVDDTRVGTCSEDEDALVFHSDCDKTLVDEQRVGFPT
jgi:hypothetical protein